MATDDSVSESVRLQAIKALDRGGLRTATQMAVGAPSTFATVIAEIAGGSHAVSRERRGIADDSFDESDPECISAAELMGDSIADISPPSQGDTRHPTTQRAAWHRASADTDDEDEEAP